MSDLLRRAVVPTRLALVYRSGETVGYNPNANVWHRLPPDVAEALRWLRAGRDRRSLADHLSRRFGLGAEEAVVRAEEIVRWCLLRRLLHLDAEPRLPDEASEPRLSSVYWICTQACNLRCTYCYQDATVARPRELTTAEGLDLVDQAVEAGADTFVFTGGEPFARRDLLKIARHSKRSGLRTNVITNGAFVTSRRIREVAATFDRVTVSLDHGIPEHHDHFRGAGSWRRAADAIDLLIGAGVQVDVNSVITQLGVADVKELLRFLRRRPIGEHRIVPQYPMGRGAGTRDDELTPEQLLDLEDDLHAASEALEAEGAPEGGHACAAEGAAAGKGVRRSHCGAGRSEVSVDPEGWVYPCRLLQYDRNRTANVREQRLAEIFTSDPRLVPIQAPFVGRLQPCSTCIIRNQCGGGCRGIHASFTGDWATAAPLFCAQLRRIFEVEMFSSTGSTPRRRASRFSMIDDAPVGEVAFIPLSQVGRR